MNPSNTIDQNIGAFDLSIAFSAIKDVTALLESYASGKTTVLKAIAGLVWPNAGHIEISGYTIFDSEKRIKLSAHKRQVGHVFRIFGFFCISRLKVILNIRLNLEAKGVNLIISSLIYWELVLC